MPLTDTTPKRGSATKQRLLDAAQRLMLAQGFSATTVESICAAAKLTKGSFFHYFDSKEQLGQELLERFCREFQDRLQSKLARLEDPLERIDAAIEHAIDLSAACANQPGCLLGTFAQELSDTHPKMRNACQCAFTEWAKRLEQDFEEAKQRYAPQAQVDARSLAEHFIAVVEGAKILAKTSGDGRMEQRSLRHLQRYVHMVFGR